MDQKTQNIKKNLMAQVNKIFNSTNRGGYATRGRYKDATERFCTFLASEFKLQKFKNIREKHVTSYVEHLQSEGKGASTIKTDISGIRFAHGLSGSRNPFPENSKLDLEKREYNKVDRAWTLGEILDAKQYALITDREDVWHALNLSEHFGLRVEGTCLATFNHLKEALTTGELYTKEKGGLERYIPITTKEQVKAIKEAMSYSSANGRRGGDKILVDGVKGGVESQIKSIQNWVYNHRSKFQDDSLRNKQNLEKFKQIAEKQGFKMRSENLSFHGLRYKYAQNRYEVLKKEGFSENAIKEKVSRELGHYRPSITNIYLAHKP